LVLSTWGVLETPLFIVMLPVVQVLSVGLSETLLRDEIYLQVMKQTIANPNEYVMNSFSLPSSGLFTC